MKKKTILRGVAIMTTLAATMVTLYSCEKWGDDYDRNQSLNAPKEYEVIGEKHNEGLGFAFNAIRSNYEATTTRNGTFTPMSMDELLALGKQATIDFCSKNISGVPEGFCAEVINQSERIATRSGNSSVNAEVNVYIKMIKNALKDEPKSLEDLIIRLNKINEQASNNLSEQDAVAVYAGTVTCYNSYIYWQENFMKWVIAIKFPDLLAQYSDEELNSFRFIDGELMAPRIATRGWWSDAWSSVGETWDAFSNSASNWWYNGGGQEVVGTDAGGAVRGALSGAIAGMAAAGTLSLPAALAGAVAEGTLSSIDSAIQYWVKH